MGETGWQEREMPGHNLASRRQRQEAKVGIIFKAEFQRCASVSQSSHPKIPHTPQTAPLTGTRCVNTCHCGGHFRPKLHDTSCVQSGFHPIFSPSLLLTSSYFLFVLETGSVSNPVPLSAGITTSSHLIYILNRGEIVLIHSMVSRDSQLIPCNAYMF